MISCIHFCAYSREIFTKLSVFFLRRYETSLINLVLQHRKKP